MRLRFSALFLIINLLLLAGSAANLPLTHPFPTPQGYDYGRRGSRLATAAVLARFAIVSESGRGLVARITIAKGPEYAANDPDQYGYPGCTLLSALTGGFFEDMDSAQVVLCWKDRQHQSHVADNLIPGPTLGRRRAAVWEWSDESVKDTVCVRLPIGDDAVELTVLVIYTDVLYAYTDFATGPEDGPAIIASWDARRTGGTWEVTPRDEVGLGATPDMTPAARQLAVDQIRTLIEQRTDGRYSLQARYNIGMIPDSAPGRVIEYDSGFDIIPTPAATPRPHPVP